MEYQELQLCRVFRCAGSFGGERWKSKICRGKIWSRWWKVQDTCRWLLIVVCFSCSALISYQSSSSEFCYKCVGTWVTLSENDWVHCRRSNLMLLVKVRKLSLLLLMLRLDNRIRILHRLESVHAVLQNLASKQTVTAMISGSIPDPQGISITTLPPYIPVHFLAEEC